MMKTIILLSACFLLFISPVFAQGDIIHWSKDTPLTWDDFKGPVDPQSPFQATTDWALKYSYHWSSTNGVITITFKIDGFFTKSRSWSIPEKRTDELLAHEQLHFDICELFTGKLSIALNAKTYTSNYKTEIIDVYQEIINETKAMQAKYDEETEHSKNKPKQAEWAVFVKQQLDATPPYN